MRVLITGAAGYIGRHVVKQVLDMGHEVIASDFRFDGVDPRAEQSRVSAVQRRPRIFMNSLASRMRCIHLAWPGWIRT